MPEAGLYIHIPFCEKKCGYCDFYSVTNAERKEEFVSALLREIQLVGTQYPQLTFDTVFWGGGTPTTLSVAALETIWNALQKHFKIAADGEFTIEANPGTLDRQKLKALRRMGFNRLSLGVQSFNDPDLKFLGRIHSARDALLTFREAREAGFENINLDLMTAFPGLTEARFQKTLNQAVQLQPEHLSCYTLIFEPNTPFYTRLKRGEFAAVSQDQEANFYRQAYRVLKDAGYQAYEISNFSREKKFRCRHNLKYWTHLPYLGLGPSSHSFVNGRRWWNHRTLDFYVKALQEDALPVAQQEVLDKTSLEFEFIFLRLRLREGIPLREYERKFHSAFPDKYREVVEKLINNGLLVRRNGYIALSTKGWLLADAVAQEF